MAAIKEPLIIYRDILIPLMKAAGFVLDFDASDDKRYHTRFIWRSSYVETDVKSEFYGQNRQFESKVDVVGIPMGFSFLILHGIVVGSLADDIDDVKIKIRCSPRSKSLSVSSNDSNGSSHSNLLMNRSSSLEKSVEESDGERIERIRLQLQSEFVHKLIELFSLRMDDLPAELKLRILSNLPLKSIITMSTVSTHWRELSLDEQLWRLMVQKFFPDVYERRVIGQSWKALFKDEFRRQRVLEKRRAFARERGGHLMALPPSPPLLPIGWLPFYPMLPPPPTFYRDLLHPNPFLDPFWDEGGPAGMGPDVAPPRPPNNRFNSFQHY